MTPCVADDAANPSFFELTKIHAIHLEFSPDEWTAIEPSGRGKPKDASRKYHLGRFPWTVADVTIDGKSYRNAGVRYKGNASFGLTRGRLKRSLKVRLDWTRDGQRHAGIRTFNLNAGGLDPSKMRDALAYSVFRDAGVPAPRTTFAEVTLTVPGKFDRELVGLYTVIEQVDKAFLKDRFGSKKGLLLKPQGIHSVDYLGGDWDSYVPGYRPDDEPLVSQAKRLISFARLVNDSDDELFRSQIRSFIDVDSFLRFVAINGLIVNLDSFLAMAQNYYLHLDRKTGTFTFFPWDLDISFAGWPLGGSADEQMQLSIFHPHGNDHRLIDRVLALDGVEKRYRDLVTELTQGAFSRASLSARIKTLQKAIAKALERETAALNRRGEPDYRSPRPGFQPPPLKEFVASRFAAIEKQLANPSEGYRYSSNFRLRHHGQLVGRTQTAGVIMAHGDVDRNGLLTKEEFLDLASRWFDAADESGSGSLNRESFVRSLPRAFLPERTKIIVLESYLAAGLFAAADPDGDGIATKKGLTATFSDWFSKWDSEGKNEISGRSVAQGLRRVIRR